MGLDKCTHCQKFLAKLEGFTDIQGMNFCGHKCFEANRITQQNQPPVGVEKWQAIVHIMTASGVAFKPCGDLVIYLNHGDIVAMRTNSGHNTKPFETFDYMNCYLDMDIKEWFLYDKEWLKNKKDKWMKSNLKTSDFTIKVSKNG